MGPLKIGLANMNDSLATRVAYKLNLRGAAFAVQSFCSTSLVAVHLACQSLLNRESDMALAGGVTIAFSQNTGYLYQEGGILSPDGHTRTFDAKGQGMVFGNGLGVVVLKRLEDALSDGDNVRAVILGHGHQQRRLDEGGLHRAQRRPGRPRSSWRRSRPRTSIRRPSATSRPTARPPRSAIPRRSPA